VLNQDCTATLFGTLSNSKTHASLNRKLGIVLQDFATYNTDDIAAGLQDFLICVEMFLAALAHAYCFPPRDYADPTHPRTGFLKSIKIMFDVRDVVDDVQYAVDDTVDTPPLLCSSTASFLPANNSVICRLTTMHTPCLPKLPSLVPFCLFYNIYQAPHPPPLIIFMNLLGKEGSTCILYRRYALH